MRMLAMKGTRPIRSRRTLVALSALIICACSRPEDAPDVAAAAEELGIPSHAVDLATLQPVGTPVNGWGPYELNRSNGEWGAGDGGPISTGGWEYSTGFGVHANSELVFDTVPGCATFSAVVGVDAEVGNRGSVIFELWDGSSRLLYRSPIKHGGEEASYPSVYVGDVSRLRLVVTDAGDDFTFDHADWARPQYICIDAATAGSGGSTPTAGASGSTPIAGSGGSAPTAGASGSTPPTAGSDSGDVDDPATPGDDRAGYFSCRVSSEVCGPDEFCCGASAGSGRGCIPKGSACGPAPVYCDGPEDCQAGQSCAWGTSHYGVSCGVIGSGPQWYGAVCHTSADCPAGQACSTDGYCRAS